MSRLKPSANYLIVNYLLICPQQLKYMRELIPGFSKRLYDLKKMGFEFEEVTDTVTGELCIDMTHIPEEAYIDRHKQIIKVSNYHRNYRNKLEMERIEEEYQSKFATPSLWIAIKNYLDKLFK